RRIRLLCNCLVNQTVAVVVEAIVSSPVEKETDFGWLAFVVIRGGVNNAVLIIVSAIRRPAWMFVYETVQIVVGAIAVEYPFKRQRYPNRVVEAIAVVVDVGPEIDLLIVEERLTQKSIRVSVKRIQVVYGRAVGCFSP